MQSQPCFLCDEMLAGLARWLRAAGYDTALAAGGAGDGVLMALAAAERRLLLTRDRAILQRKGAGARVVVLAGVGLDAWARELGARLELDWRRAPFTRCMVCNTLLTVAPDDAVALVPDRSRRLGPLKWCPRCARPYWPGGHVRRMAARLERWSHERESCRDGSEPFRARDCCSV